jgi:hypothetical protein
MENTVKESETVRSLVITQLNLLRGSLARLATSLESGTFCLFDDDA